MPRGNKKAGNRRLVDMSPAPAEDAWWPDLPPEPPDFEQVFPVSATTSYIVRCGYDERGNLAAWAVIQMCNENGVARRVAVYDACHGKGMHVHLYDRLETEIDEHPLREVRSYADQEAAVDYATERVVKDWQENERRSKRGH